MKKIIAILAIVGSAFFALPAEASQAPTLSNSVQRFVYWFALPGEAVSIHNCRHQPKLLACTIREVDSNPSGWTSSPNLEIDKVTYVTRVRAERQPHGCVLVHTIHVVRETKRIYCRD